MYVYLLECDDGTIYTGITNNLERRFSEHSSGHGAVYTKMRGAKKVLYYEWKKTRRLARIRELEIKTWDHQSKLDLVNGVLKNPIVIREWDYRARKWINLDQIRLGPDEPPIAQKVGRIFFGTNFIPPKSWRFW